VNLNLKLETEPFVENITPKSVKVYEVCIKIDVKYQYEKSDSSFHLGELLTLRFQEGNNREGD